MLMRPKMELLRSSAAIFALKASAAGLVFLNSVILARMLSINAYGMFSQVLAVVTTIATLLTLGMPSLLTREIAAHHAQQRWAPLRGIVHWAYRKVLFACLILFLASLSLAAYAPVPWRIPAVIGMGMVFLVALNQLRAAVLRGLHRVVAADVPETVAQPLTILCLIGITYPFAAQYGATWAVALHFIGALAALVMGWIFLHKAWPNACRYATIELDTKEWRSASAIFFLISGLAVVDGQITVILTGMLANSEQAGVFQACSRLVGLVVFSLMVINAPLLPRLAVAWANDDRSEMQTLVTQAMGIGCIGAIVVSIPMLLYPGWFLGFFGSEYSQGSLALQILVFGQLANAFSGPCAMVLAMTGHQSLALRALSAAVVVNVLLNLGLTARLGVTGAAIAVTGSLITWNLLMVYWARKKTKIITAAYLSFRELAS